MIWVIATQILGNVRREVLSPISPPVPVDDGGQKTEEKLLRDGDKREKPQVVEQQYPE